MGNRGVVLTGLLGAGKTTMVRKLSVHFNAVVPVTTTTRAVAPDDLALQNLSRQSFVAEVRQRNILMPIISGDDLYGWTEEALDVMRNEPRVVLSVRPYTALALSALIPDLCAVWLDLPEDVRRQRINRRNAGRDTERHREPRDSFDSIDAQYRSLFSRLCDSRNVSVEDFGAYFG